MHFIICFILQISVILANLFSKNYSNVHLQIIEQNHLKAGTLMHELYFISNGTILLYTLVIPPIDLVEHVRYTDVGSM